MSGRRAATMWTGRALSVLAILFLAFDAVFPVLVGCLLWAGLMLRDQTWRASLLPAAS